jgi:phosphate/sulfate permease
LDSIAIAAIFGLGMLIWACVEVGRNDAANLINAVFGARVMRRRTAVWIAGLAVVLGASFSAPVVETARKGIFDPTVLTIQAAAAIYVSVYIVDTILLYTYSAFGMPVSTTATLVFSLIGAALALAGHDNIQWPKATAVIVSIVVSILMAGMAGFLVQRVFRGAIRDKAQDRETVLLHGPWIAGAMLTWLGWYMVFKGLKNVALIDRLREITFDQHGVLAVLLVMWGIFTLLIHLALSFTGERGTRHLFHVTAVIGMICLAFAFGQNDLANCASPGLSALWLWRHPDETAALATGVSIPVWALFGCGFLMAWGMNTRKAQRVTRAAVNTGSQFDHVALYAPGWCRAIARLVVRARHPDPRLELAPQPSVDDRGKKIHYDTLRASVIMAVSASVIAFASGNGLPVSTTYVAFAAVVATGMADRVFTRGDADLKMGRAIWVVTSWFLAAAVAVVASGGVVRVVYHLGGPGLIIALVVNLTVVYFVSRRSATHEQLHHEAFERRSGAAGMSPDTMDE